MATILLIDDNEDICDLLRVYLSEDNHGVTVAHDGVEALAVLKENRFDLIITDLVMPNKNGIALITELVNQPHRPPIIAMSGVLKHPDFDSVSAVTLGVSDILLKPFDQLTLANAVIKALNCPTPLRHAPSDS